jgi:hypothetical protein
VDLGCEGMLEEVFISDFRLDTGVFPEVLRKITKITGLYEGVS